VPVAYSRIRGYSVVRPAAGGALANTPKRGGKMENEKYGLSYLERRRGRVTASMVSAIVGVDPRRNAYDAALAVLERVDAFEGNLATEAGHALEAAVIAWGARELGTSVAASNQWRVGDVWTGSPAEKRVGSTLDAVLANGSVLEAKTAGIYNPMFAGEEWGEAGTDQVPQNYLVQVHMQMLCSGLRVAHLAALLGNGMGFRLYTVPFDAEIGAIVFERVCDFWRTLDAGNMPDATPSPESVRRIRRVAGSGFVLTDADQADRIARWEELRAQRIELAKTEEAAKYEALAGLEHAERLLLPDGRVLDYALGSVTRLDQARLKSDHPAVLDDCTRSFPQRTARVRKARKGEAEQIRAFGELPPPPPPPAGVVEEVSLAE